uniref:Uncharacterized protein n=1 Tax=Anguilla anguilla TaxID=7936 RepID=A0A0E9U0V0_ANGAN
MHFPSTPLTQSTITLVLLFDHILFTHNSFVAHNIKSLEKKSEAHFNICFFELLLLYYAELRNSLS